MTHGQDDLTLDDLYLQVSSNEEVTDQEILDALGDDDGDDKPEAVEPAPTPVTPLTVEPPSPRRDLPLPERSGDQIQRFLKGPDHASDDDDDIQGESPEATKALLRDLEDGASTDHPEAIAAPFQDDKPEAVAAPQTLPANAPVEPDDALTDDDIAELDEKDERLAAVYAEPGPAKVTTPEGLARLRKQTAMIRDYIVKDNLKKAARTAERYQASIEAAARIHAAERQARADARRARDVVGRRTKRAAEITPKRIAALDDAIATKGGKFYVKLAILGAQEYAVFREALTEARRVHGDGASMKEIAATWSTMARVKKTKPMVQNRLDAVDKLEAKGGPWYPWRKA